MRYEVTRWFSEQRKEVFCNFKRLHQAKRYAEAQANQNWLGDIFTVKDTDTNSVVACYGRGKL